LKDGKNYWISSGAYAIFQRMGGFLFGFGSYFFLVRYFDVESFGVWTLFLVLSTSIEMSRSAFIQNAFIKFYNQSETDKDFLFTSSLFLNTASTFLFLIILLMLSPLLQAFWKSETIGLLIYCYCVTSIILIPFTQLNYLEQANHQFSGVFWSTIVRQGAFFAVVVVCYTFFPGLSLVFFGVMQTVMALVGLVVAFFLTKNFMPTHYKFSWQDVSKLFKFGKYILGTGFTSTIGKNADQVILGNASHSMVALYNAGVRILNLIEIPSLSISNIVYPKIAERANSHGNSGAGLLYEKSVATILAIILPVVLIVFLFPGFVLFITAGRKYMDSADILRIMVSVSLLIPFNIQIGSALEVINKPQVSFYVNLISNLLNVALNIVLIRLYGAIGAAIAFAITISFIFFIGQYFVSKFLKVSLWRTFKQVILVYKEGYGLLLKYDKK